MIFTAPLLPSPAGMGRGHGPRAMPGRQDRCPSVFPSARRQSPVRPLPARPGRVALMPVDPPCRPRPPRPAAAPPRPELPHYREVAGNLVLALPAPGGERGRIHLAGSIHRRSAGGRLPLRTHGSAGLSGLFGLFGLSGWRSSDHRAGPTTCGSRSTLVAVLRRTPPGAGSSPGVRAREERPRHGRRGGAGERSDRYGRRGATGRRQAEAWRVGGRGACGRVVVRRSGGRGRRTQAGGRQIRPHHGPHPPVRLRSGHRPPGGPLLPLVPGTRRGGPHGSGHPRSAGPFPAAQDPDGACDAADPSHLSGQYGS